MRTQAREGSPCSIPSSISSTRGLPSTRRSGASSSSPACSRWPGSSRARAGGSPCACSPGTRAGTARATSRRPGKMVNLKRRETLVSIIRAGDHLHRLRRGDRPLHRPAHRRARPADGDRRSLVPDHRGGLRDPEDPRRHHRRPDHVRGALVLGRRHGRRPRAARAPGRRRGRLAPTHAASLGDRRGHPHPQLADPGRQGPAARREGARHRALRQQARRRRAARARGRLDPARRPDDVRPQAVGRADRRALGEPHAHPHPHDRRSGPRVARRRVLLRPAQGAGRRIR